MFPSGTKGQVMRHVSNFASGSNARATAALKEVLADRVEARKPAVLQPGRNCWRVAQATRAAVLIDADAYFARLDQALRAARRSILVLGWDLDAAIRLRPDAGDDERLGPLLRSLVEARPDLEIRILVWNLSTLHAPSATLPMLFGEEWQKHPRIQLRLDADHPAYAAQHEKIIAIDDAIAFVGGIDLTVDRWDTSEHLAVDSRRRTPAGKAYGPIHDIQLLVEGEAARAVAECARDRWRQVTGEHVRPSPCGGDLWPADLRPDLMDVRVGVARTRPRWKGREAVEESAQLRYDAVAAARRSVYIEAQYLTDFRLGDIVAERLQEPDGPEFVMVVTRTMHGVVEGLIMNGNRRRLVRRLKRADRYDRLRVYHPVVPGEDGECEVLIHAKILIVDDVFLRIGSSNLNNRSTGLDLECDLGIEANNPAARRSIAAIRERLLAEHLGVAPEAMAEACAAEQSMIRAIGRMNKGCRGLSDFDYQPKGPITPMPGTRLLDPRRPSPLRSLLWPRRRRR